MSALDAIDAGRRTTPERAKTARLGLSRTLLIQLLMLGSVVLVAAISGYVWISGGRFVATDNAYVQAAKLEVATDISGLVASVDVHEGQRVQKGEVLFRLDTLPFQIALDNAKAQLALAALSLQSLQMDYKRLLSDIEAQTANMKLAQATSDRNAKAAKSGAVTLEVVDQSRAALNSANAQHDSLLQQARVALAKLGGDPDLPVTQHPTYLQIKAQVDEAQRQLDHTVVRAPFTGVVTQVDQLQPGSFLVAANAALTNTGAVALVATDNLWIDANFKETDLTYAVAGDPVQLTVDAFPGKTWTGKVASISPASGAQFSILPPQNASGNWVKVVQRIPVRIAIDKQEGSVLRAGMSVSVTIDTGHRRTLDELW